MTLRKLFAILIAAILFAGSPAFAASGAGGSADCAGVSAPADDCCGGNTDTAYCSVACLISPSLLFSNLTDWRVPTSGVRLIQEAATHERSLAWPPDTAPPKPRSA